MKKLIFIVLMLCMLSSPVHAALSYGESFYTTNKASALSGVDGVDPLYSFINEVEDYLEGTTAIDDLLVTDTIGLLESTGATYYTYLQAGNQSGDLTYTLPTGYGTTGQYLSATDAGVMSWGTPSATFAGGSVTGDIVMANGIYLQSSETTAQASAIQVWDTTAVAAYSNVLSWVNQGVPDIVLGAATNTVAITSTGLNVTAAGAVTGVTDLTADTLSVTTLYENAIVAAAVGNVALTMDGAGNGTIGIGLTSTGLITLGRGTTLNSTLDVTGATGLDGAVTLGNAAADNITITGDVIANVTLDDDTTDSPSIILRDAGENDWIFLKANGAGGHLTATADAGTSSLHIVAGNLEVGTGAPGTAAMDGEDFYVKGDSEFDGAVQFDGLPTGSAGLTVTGAAVSLNTSSNYAANVCAGTSTGTVTIGSSAGQIITIGNGAAAKTVSLGSSNTTSTTTILGGSNGVNINVNALNDPTNINTGVNTGTVTIGGTGAQSIAIGDGGTGAKTITIGDAAAAGSTTIKAGTGNLIMSAVDDISLNGGSAGSIIDIGVNTQGNVINIATNDTTLDDLNIGSVKDTVSITGIDVTLVSGATGVLINNNTNQLVGIGTGTATGTVTIGGTGTQSIAIGNGVGIKTVALGSITTSSATAISSGTGDLDLIATAILDIDVGTTYDMLAAGAFSFDGANAASNISLATNTANDDFTISITGATDSSLILASSGTGTDALKISTSNALGDIDIDSADDLTLDTVGLMGVTIGGTYTITPTGEYLVDATAGLTLDSAEVATDAIKLSASAGGGILSTASAVPDGGYGTKLSGTMATATKSEGLGAYVEGNTSGNADGKVYGLGAWLNITAGTPTDGPDSIMAGADIGIYAAAAPELAATQLRVLNLEYQVHTDAAPVEKTSMINFSADSGGDVPDYLFTFANADSAVYTANATHTAASTDKVGAIKITITGAVATGYIYVYSNAGQ